MTEHFASFTRNIPIAAGIFGPEGFLKAYNRAYQELFAARPARTSLGVYNIMQDSLLTAATDQSNGRSLGSMLEKAFSGDCPPPVVVEVQIDPKDAQPAAGLSILEVTAFPMADGVSAPAAFVVFLRDLSQERLAARALAESEKRYRTLTDALPDMLFCIAPDQTILFVNTFAAQQFRAKPEDLQGRKLSDVFPAPVAARMWGHITVVFETLKPVYTENETPFGPVTRWLDTWIVPLLDEQGRAYAVMGVSRDTTEKIKYRQEVERTHNLEALSVLAGGLAHDFNNILTAVLSNLSLLKEGCAGCDPRYRSIEFAEKGALRAKALASQLLTFAKGGAPVKEQASMGSLIMDSVGFVVHGSNSRCRFTIPDDLWPCDVDASQISQVLQNLAINALQAMPQGGLIDVEAENVLAGDSHPSGLRGRLIRVSLADQGTGISEEERDKVFLPFYSTKRGGSGLGLAICQSIIHKHGGSLDFTSQSGQGSIFTMYLPASDVKAEVYTPGAPAVKPSLQGRHILVVDDEEMVRSSLKLLLRHLGCTATLCADGFEALSLYRASMGSGEGFDLVILDLTLPGSMDGLAIMAQLLKINPGARVMVSSGYSNSPILAEPAAHGFKAILRKPFTLPELEDALCQALLA